MGTHQYDNRAAIDVTRGNRANEEVQRSEARLATVLDHLREGLVIASWNGDVFYWNAAALSMHGFATLDDARLRVEQYKGMFELWTPDKKRELPFDEWPIPRLIRGQRGERRELCLRRPAQGWERTISFSGKIVETSTGEQLIHMSMIDLTDQRRAEAALRDSEGRLRLFIEHAPAAIAMFDVEMRYLAVSRRWKDDYHIKGDVIGLLHYDVFPEIPERWKEIHRRGLSGEVLKAEEDAFLREDGSTQWIKWEVLPWHKAGGELGGILMTAEEITARVLAKQALLESETVLRTVTNEAPVGLVIVDKNRRYRYVNHTYIKIFDIQDESIVGKRVADVIGKLYDQVSIKLDIAFTGQRAAYVFRLPDAAQGSDRFYEIVYQPRTENREDPYVVVVIVDITERKRTEERLNKQRLVLKSVTDNAAVALFIMDGRQHCTFMNPAAEKLTGFKLHDIRGKPLHDAIHHSHRDGSHYPQAECPISRTSPKSNQEQGEDVFVHADGHFYDVVFTASPINDRFGRPIGTVVEVRDITQEKHAAQELRLSEIRHRQLSEALQEAARRKDEFLAMLAHELRNPLAPIRNAAALLQRLGNADAKIVRASEIIARQVSHMARLVDDLLDVSRIARGKITLKKERVDLSEVIRNVAEDHRTAIEAAGLSMQVSLPDGPCYVSGDQMRLAQVFSNLIHNANKFTPTGGDVFIDCSCATNQAIIHVRDTGIGMNSDLLRHIFEPFVQADSSLDRSKGGLGLGLALAKGIIQLHSGQLTAESQGRGAGSTFIVRMPLIDEHAEPRENEGRHASNR